MHFILTHDDFDGFTCATIRKHYLLDLGYKEDQMMIKHIQYGKDFDIELQKGDAVDILDFSYSLETMENLSRILRERLFHVDHHDVDSRIGHIPGCNLFRGGSATMHLWTYLYDACPNKVIPMLVRYAHDYDSWTHALEKTHYINAYLITNKKGRDQKLMDALYNNFEVESEQVMTIGKFIVDNVDEWCSRTFKDADRLSYCKIDGFKTLFLNSSDNTNRSQIADRGMKLLNVPNAIVYCIFHDGVLFNVRGTGAGFNVGEFCSRYGGGGRQDTGAFKTSLEQGLQLIQRAVSENVL